MLRRSFLFSLLATSSAFAQQKKPAKPKEEELAAPKRYPRPKALGVESSHAELVSNLNTYWNSVRFGSSDFVQIGPDGRRTEGRLFFNKPGLLRFEYDPPNPVEIVADGKGVIVRDRKLATQDVYPLSQTPLQFLLANKVDLAKDNNVTSISREADVILVMLEEKKAIGGTHRLMLVFNAKDYSLKQWTITDAQGYDTSIAIHNLNATTKPNASLFVIDYTKYN
jgi:outer membrane lipoprotein-sorting protein